MAAQNNNPRPIVFKTSFANPHPTRIGTANAIPAAPSAATVLGRQLAKRHWSIEPREAWVVQPREPPTPATWPQKVLHSGVYIVEAAGALSGVALCAIVVGGWRTAKSLYQNRRPLQQECTMAVVTEYRAAKRRLVTLRMPAMPIQSTWRRQFDPAARTNGSSSTVASFGKGSPDKTMQWRVLSQPTKLSSLLPLQDTQSPRIIPPSKYSASLKINPGLSGHRTADFGWGKDEGHEGPLRIRTRLI